jgi:hypothetical protein
MSKLTKLTYFKEISLRHMQKSTNEASALRYGLDRSSKKFPCPRCNKRRFVKYVDTCTGEYLSDEYGRCDREVSCGYWLKPEVPIPPVRQPVRTRPSQKKVYVPFNIFKGSRRGYEANSFVTYLLTIFDEPTVTQVIKDYAIGTSKYFNGGCVFWFLDLFGNVVAGQIKAFDLTGHTVKNEDKAITTWVHSVMRDEPWAKEYSQQDRKISCLFGEHLLRANPGKPVALVEAPKTAIIASIYFPKYLWLAVGSLSYLTADRVTVLNGRHVVLFPDLNAYHKWEEKGSQFGFMTSDILETNVTVEQREAGLDIADFVAKVGVEDFLRTKIFMPSEPAVIKQEFDLSGGLIDPILGFPVAWKTDGKTTLTRLME